MKLWQKDYTIDQQMEAFTVGRDRELDLLLAPFDVLGSLAHSRMLWQAGLLDEADYLQLRDGLQQIYREVEQGEFRIEEGVEDVHSQVELLLTQRLGEVGKRLHTGRSRNDQVLLDLKMFFREALWKLAAHAERLGAQLLELSRVHEQVLLPGYTHYQVAMPSSFGLWFSAYAEALADDLLGLHAAYQVADRNPLGSGAGYGSSFPLDRALTTELLGFGSMANNVVYAQMGRGKTEFSIACALAGLAGTMGKFSQDCVLYLCQNFGFLSFPETLTTGSSIMPHKKNPDAFELIRARCNQLATLPAQVGAICGNLPSGYHRDFQQLKELLLPAFQTLHSCLDMLELMMSHVEVKQDILDKPLYDYLFSVEAVNALVLQGVPFREAYRQVGQQIQEGNFSPERQIAHTHAGSIGNPGQDAIQERLQAQLQAFGYEKVEHCFSKLQA